MKHFTKIQKTHPGTVQGMHTQHPTRHEFKGLTDWIEVFKAGTHTDSKGQKCTFGLQDVQQMAANHALGRAPAVLGHPKHDDPAYAWVDGFKVEGQSLYAKFTDINPQFEAGVKSKAYSNRSLSIYKDPAHGWRVRHVGWLGAQPPAIEGLKPVEFAADVECLEFAMADEAAYSLGYALADTADLLRGLRDSLIADKGVEAADAVLPAWRIQSIADAAKRMQEAAAEAALAEATATPNPFSKPDTGVTMQFTQEQLDAAAAQAAKDAEAAAALKFQAQGLELTELRALRTLEQVNGTIQAATAAGKLPPALVPGLAEFMVSLEQAPQEFSFSASAGSEVKKTPSQFFHDFLAALPVRVKLGGGIGNDGGQELDKTSHVAIADAAREFQASEQKAGRTIPFESAVAAVMAR